MTYPIMRFAVVLWMLVVWAPSQTLAQDASPRAPYTGPPSSDGRVPLADTPKLQPNLGSPRPEPAEKPGATKTETKIFPLLHIPAERAGQIIQQLYNEDLDSLAFDEHTSQLIARGEPEVLREIGMVLTQLDQPREEKTTEPSAKTDYDVAEHSAFRKEISRLQANYQAAKQRVAELAGRYRRKAASDSEDPQIPELRKQLRAAVAEAFRSRQHLHRVELEALRHRLRRIADIQDVRNRIRDQIIDRRVEQLIDPALERKVGTGDESFSSGAAPPANDHRPKTSDQSAELTAGSSGNMMMGDAGENLSSQPSSMNESRQLKSINVAEVNRRLAKINSDDEFVEQAYRQFLDRSPTNLEREAFIKSRDADKRQLLVVDLLDKSGHVVKQLLLPEDGSKSQAPSSAF